MNSRLKLELKMRCQIAGYFTITCDDLLERQIFVEDVKKEISEIEVLSEYFLKFSEIDILKQKLQDHCVMLINLEEKLEEIYLNNYETTVSKKESIYYSLIQFRELLKKHPLILLCDKELAKLILCNNSEYSSNLTSFTHNRMDLDKFKNIEEQTENNNIIYKIKKLGK